MTPKTASSPDLSPRGLSPSDIARFQRSLYDRSRRFRRARLLVVLRIARTCLAGVIAGIRLGRAAPPLGDIGTRGGDLTRWITERNRRS